MKRAWTVFLWSIGMLFVITIYIGCAGEDYMMLPSEETQMASAGDRNQYIIGPEDVLSINIWKEESITTTVPVRIDGKISLPLLNDVQAAGLTPLQLKDVLTDKLRGFMENPTVTVTVTEANSFKVYVTGEVKQPGVFHIRSEISLVKLIIMAGGFSDWADQEDILIITKEKGKEKRITVNYKDIIDGEVPDIVINRGDTVIVR